MSEQHNNKEKASSHKTVLFCVFWMAICVVASCILISNQQREFEALENDRVQSNEIFLSSLMLDDTELFLNGFWSLDLAMNACGYEKMDDYVYMNDGEPMQINIEFDFGANRCKKNNYTYDISQLYYMQGSEAFVKKELLESILICSLAVCDGDIIASELAYGPHDWIDNSSGLIAHAGGAIRDKTYNSMYTNSLEAIIESYNLGHRLFEIDFCLTTDQRLAAVHDWKEQGKQDDQPMSSTEWEEMSAYGKPMTDGRYTSLFLENVLDEMCVNSDLYIITDVKCADNPKEDVVLQFQMIYDAAMKRDQELINRIIPQIYFEEMYEYVMGVYPFPSIIYTIYENQDSADEIIDFAIQHDNIKVITVPKADERIDEKAIQKMHRKGLKVFTYTVNSYAEFVTQRERGMDGIYSDLLLPMDMYIYNNHGQAVKPSLLSWLSLL